MPVTNRFEQAVFDCMIPTAELLEETTKPLHRAILLNFWRHVHLEGAGEYEQIVAPDMMVDEPVKLEAERGERFWVLGAPA